MSHEKHLVLGIDLGTTYSAVAYLDEFGEAKIIASDNNERITPSVVFFENKENIIVGQNAKDEYELSPDKVVAFAKRNMGRKKEDSKGEGMPYNFYNKIYSPEEISAFILQKLKQYATREFKGIDIRDAVITVPAYFDEAKRKATKDAGAIAGLNVLQVINEPTAAAIYYATKTDQLGKNIFVFDLGGGTFDVTILNCDNTGGKISIEVKDSDGDARLGGKDWDEVIIQHCMEIFTEEHGENLKQDPEGYADLVGRAEKAKKQLSEKEKAAIPVRGHGKQTRIDLTKEQFESLSEVLLEKTRICCDRILKNNHLSWKDIDTVLLVGGSTRMPMVKRMLREISGMEIREDLVQPDECVALGAAIQGSRLKLMEGSDKNIVDTSNPVYAKLGNIDVLDILTQSIGTTYLSNDGVTKKNMLMLKRKTKLPAAKVESFVTSVENQKGVTIDVTEGESEDPEYCKILVEKVLELKRPMPKGSPLEITFTMDISGLLNVKALDLTENAAIEFQLERKNNLSDAEIQEAVNNHSNLKIKA